MTPDPYPDDVTPDPDDPQFERFMASLDRSVVLVSRIALPAPDAFMFGVPVVYTQYFDKTKKPALIDGVVYAADAAHLMSHLSQEPANSTEA